MRRMQLAAIGLAGMLLLTSAAAAGQSPAPVPSTAAQAAPLGTPADALAWLGSVGLSHVRADIRGGGIMNRQGTVTLAGTALVSGNDPDECRGTDAC